jgi:hypothetical protein
MPTLILERSSEMNNRLRNYAVYIDGEKMGTIANGETKEYDLPNGEHVIYCKIDWCSSPERTFKMDDDKIKIFKVGGFKNGKIIMPAAGLLVGFSFILKQFGIPSWYFAFLLIPVFIILVYYLTAGRKKFLCLTEV